LNRAFCDEGEMPQSMSLQEYRIVNRYVVLAASVVMQLCLGGLYAWSTFTPSLNSGYGITATQARPVSMIGAILFAGGYLFASLADGSYPSLLIGIGLISGAGIGFCYVCPLTTCLQWFPSKKGLVVGLTVAGFGGGGILWSALAEYILAHGYDIILLFRWAGIIMGSILIVTSVFMYRPFSPSKAVNQSCLPYASILSRRKFWALFAGMFAGTFGGLLVIGNLKPMGMAMGIPISQVSIAIGFFSVGNAAGRILWGAWHDRKGWPLISISLITLSGSLLSLLLAPIFGAFLLSVTLIGYSFGACFVLYAAELASWLGHQNVGRFYPLIFLSYGAAGVTGPTLGGFLYEAFGNFVPAILIASGIAGMAGSACWIADRSKHKIKLTKAIGTVSLEKALEK
jgi:OFA family oxalate/formate antiporter-like MFS transporter